MVPELVAGGGYGGLIREKPYCVFRDMQQMCPTLESGGNSYRAVKLS